MKLVSNKFKHWNDSLAAFGKKSFNKTKNFIDNHKEQIATLANTAIKTYSSINPTAAMVAKGIKSIAEATGHNSIAKVFNINENTNKKSNNTTKLAQDNSETRFIRNKYNSSKYMN